MFQKSSSNNIPVTGNSITNNDLASSYPFPQSLLSARRPSWTPSLSFRDVPSDGGSTLEDSGKTSSPSSPEDGGNFRRSLQIDNKGLVGDAVGNVSAGSILYGLLCFRYDREWLFVWLGLWGIPFLHGLLFDKGCYLRLELWIASWCGHDEFLLCFTCNQSLKLNYSFLDEYQSV